MILDLFLADMTNCEDLGRADMQRDMSHLNTLGGNLSSSSLEK